KKRRLSIIDQRNFDLESRPKHQCMARPPRKIDFEFAAEGVLVHLPESGERVSGMKDRAGRMQQRAQFKLALERHRRQPRGIKRRDIGGVMCAVYMPLQTRNIRQVRQFVGRRKISQESGEKFAVFVEISVVRWKTQPVL